MLHVLHHKYVLNDEYLAVPLDVSEVLRDVDLVHDEVIAAEALLEDRGVFSECLVLILLEHS